MMVCYGICSGNHYNFCYGFYLFSREIKGHLNVLKERHFHDYVSQGVNNMYSITVPLKVSLAIM